MRNDFRRRSRRGTVLALVVAISVVVTGLVIVMSWAASTQANMATNCAKVDQAFYAAEAGAQRVAWFCKNGKMAQITSPLSGTVGGCTYSSSWTTVSGSTIRIASQGSLGIASSTLYLTASPPSGVPVFASVGDFDNKNVAIVGNVWTNGNYSNGGSGSLTGTVTYAGTSSVSGTQGSFTPINFATLGTMLQAAAGTIYNGSQNGKTFNFTLLSGTNKVIQVNGDVTNPSFIGTGTLYVNGKISTSGFGTAAAPVNLVATGDITTSNNITAFGTLYTPTDWNRGKIDLTGLAYAGGISRSNNGHSSMTQTSPPWFDPRAAGGSGGTGTASFSSFAGAQP